MPSSKRHWTRQAQPLIPITIHQLERKTEDGPAKLSERKEELYRRASAMYSAPLAPMELPIMEKTTTKSDKNSTYKQTYGSGLQKISRKIGKETRGWEEPNDKKVRGRYTWEKSRRAQLNVAWWFTEEHTCQRDACKGRVGLCSFHRLVGSLRLDIGVCGENEWMQVHLQVEAGSWKKAGNFLWDEDKDHLIAVNHLLRCPLVSPRYTPVGPRRACVEVLRNVRCQAFAM